MVNNSLLKTIRFSETEQWNVKHFFSTTITSKYPIENIGRHTIRITKKIKLFNEPEKEFGILGISNEVGMFDAYTEFGKNINQPYIYVADGCLAYNPYRINVGSIGLKTEEISNEYISPAYIVFKCRETLLPEYLYIILKSPMLNILIKENTTGSVRQTLSYENLSKIKIPVPSSLEEQRKIVNKYKETLTRAQQLENEALEKEKNIEKFIISSLNIGRVETSNNNNILRFVPFKNFSNKWEWSEISESIEKAMKSCTYPIKTLGQTVSFVNRVWKSKNCNNEKFMYIEIGGINSTNNTATANEVFVVDAPSRATQTVESGDLIIGTTRPYLKKFAIIRNSENGYVCSSGFQVIKPSSNYDLRYIMEVLKIETTIKQFELLMTGALYPAINLEQLKQIKIPIPPIDVQVAISNHIEHEKISINNLYKKAKMLRLQAKEDFEEAVFNG